MFTFKEKPTRKSWKEYFFKIRDHVSLYKDDRYINNPITRVQEIEILEDVGLLENNDISQAIQKTDGIILKFREDARHIDQDKTLTTREKKEETLKLRKTVEAELEKDFKQRRKLIKQVESLITTLEALASDFQKYIHLDTTENYFKIFSRSLQMYLSDIKNVRFNNHFTIYEVLKSNSPIVREDVAFISYFKLRMNEQQLYGEAVKQFEEENQVFQNINKYEFERVLIDYGKKARLDFSKADNWDEKVMMVKYYLFEELRDKREKERVRNEKAMQLFEQMEDNR